MARTPMNDTPPQKTSVSIFLVDDNADTRSMLSQLLQAMGHDVVGAGRMDTALAQFPSANSDVLLSDIGLPDGDGWTLLNTLRQSGYPRLQEQLTPDQGVLLTGLFQREFLSVHRSRA